MSYLDPGLMNVPPDLQTPEREIFFTPVSEIGELTGHCGIDPAISAAIPPPTHSPSSANQSMEAIDPELNNFKSDLEDRNRDYQNRSITNFGEFSGLRGSITATDAANHPPQFSIDGFAGYRHSLQATDATNTLFQCSSDNVQAELQTSLLNSARTNFGLRFPFDKLHTEVANSGNTKSNYQLFDNSAFASNLNNDSTNTLSKLTRKFENAKFISPIPLNIENPVLPDTNSDKPMDLDNGMEPNPNQQAAQNPKKRNKICSNWMKLHLKQKVRLVNKLGASKIQMAMKKSIWIKRVKNLARKNHINLDSIQKRNKTINQEVEKLSEHEENQLKKASVDTIDKNKPENNIVADKEKREEGKIEMQEPMSYADKVGKKRHKASLFSVIKKDPKLKVGEVEMPIADILKGSEPYSTTIYGYFIEKRVNYFNMNKYGMSKWKQFGIEEVMVNEADIYFFRFSSEQGVKGVLEGGPWLVFDNPIIIRRWAPGLNMSKAQHNVVPVWVKIFNVPLEYWNETRINHIAWETGKPLEADSWTANMCNSHWGRPAFMRILMEISAEKDWLKELNVFSRDIMTDERIQAKCKIEYAWTPSKCSHCKVFGHRDSTCGILIAIVTSQKLQ
ncbi:hypothetical protein LXL04_006749 [Taraxacum kok-saghyz]